MSKCQRILNLATQVTEHEHVTCYCPFAYKWWLILLTHCPQICVRKEISRLGFLYLSRYSVVNSIDLRRVFLRYVNISIRIFGDSVSCPGCMVGRMGRISHTNLKNRMVILGVATSKNHIELLGPGHI